MGILAQSDVDEDVESHLKKTCTALQGLRAALKRGGWPQLLGVMLHPHTTLGKGQAKSSWTLDEKEKTCSNLQTSSMLLAPVFAQTESPRVDSSLLTVSLFEAVVAIASAVQMHRVAINFQLAASSPSAEVPSMISYLFPLACYIFNTTLLCQTRWKAGDRTVLLWALFGMLLGTVAAFAHDVDAVQFCLAYEPPWILVGLGVGWFIHAQSHVMEITSSSRRPLRVALP